MNLLNLLPTVRISFLGLLFSLLLSANLMAQSRTFLAKGPEGIQTFELDVTRVLVSFKAGTTEAQKKVLVRQVSEKLLYNANLEMPTLAATTLEVKPGANESQINQLLEDLNKLPAIHYAAPFLLFKDGTPQGILNQINVGLKNASDINWLLTACQGLRLEKPKQNEFDPLVYTVEVPDNSMGKAFDLANQLYESGKPAFAEVNFIKYLKPFTNDPMNVAQWAQENTGQYWNGYSWIPVGTPDADMDIQGAWQISTGNSSIKVAVIDEGVDIYHPDLIGNMLSGYDATGYGSAGNASGNDAHGTACAGIIAAKANNGIGLAGNAYNCKIIPIRIAYHALGQTTWTFSDTWAANGINWAWQTGGASILSNSWGGGSSSAMINTAIQNAVTNGRSGKGAPVLFAAGNDNVYGVSNPSAYSSAISVGASSMCDQRKSYTSCDGESTWGSNYGPGLDIMAPGVKIATTDISGLAGYNLGDYSYTFNGTSSACPNAAGVMALILSVNSNLTAAQARAILESSCQKVSGYAYSTNSNQPNGTWNSEMGYGRVNAQAACVAAQGATCNAPTVSQLSTSNVANTSVRLNCSVSGVQAYDWRYRKVGVTTWTDLNSGTANYVNISGLLANTAYEFAAAVRCNATVWSTWSDSKSFTTTGSGTCNAPTSSQLSVTYITGNAARLNCLVSGVQAYDFIYRKVGVSAWTDLPGSTNNYVDITGLLSNTQYEFCASVRCNATTWSAWSVSKTFFTLNTTPSNDNVCSPTTISAGSSCSYVSGNTNGATASSSGTTCGTTAPLDVWFKCSIPSSGLVTFRTSAGTLTDGVMAVYWGSSCSSLNYITCEDDNDNGNGSTMPVIGITGQAGTLLWIRVWGFSNSTGTFGICAVNYNTINMTSGSGEEMVTKMYAVPDVQAKAGIPTEHFLDAPIEALVENAQDRIDNMDHTDITETTNASIGLVYPNPASSQVMVPYTLQARANVQFTVVDLPGRILHTQTIEQQESGDYQEALDLSKLSTGTYFLRIQAGEQTSMQQIKVIK